MKASVLLGAAASMVPEERERARSAETERGLAVTRARKRCANGSSFPLCCLLRACVRALLSRFGSDRFR